METIFGKLTDLGYELFGVIIPGLIAGLFGIVLWIALGPMVPRWTFNAVRQLDVSTFFSLIKSNDGMTLASFVLAGVACYFLGHAVNWSSKARPKAAAGAQPWKQRWLRVRGFLTLHVEKPERSYHQTMEPLLRAVESKFTHDKTVLEWGAFYPIARNVLSNSGRRSLLSTYQNKYTLHRSIAAASACWFWVTIVLAAWAGLAVHFQGAPAPNWLMLGVTGLSALFFLTGFSATYQYYWMLWGDSVIGESYALIYGPQPKAKDETPK